MIRNKNDARFLNKTLAARKQWIMPSKSEKIYLFFEKNHF